MVTEIIDASADLAISPRMLWKLLVDPDTYPRLFPGIGACDPVETIDGPPSWRMRVGTADTEIRVLDLRLVLNREAHTVELQCPAQGSFAAARLRGGPEGTHVVITCFAPARVHPLVASLSNSAVVEWIKAGLKRMIDLADRAPTSVLVNGEESSIRLQAGVAKQMLTTGVVRTYRPDRIFRQLSNLSAWGFTLAGGYAAAAAHSPRRTAIIDDRGERTFRQVHTRSHALASAMGELGLGAGDSIGVLSRNHAEMVEIMSAASKLGVDAILFNLGQPAGRIAEIAETTGIAMLFTDPDLEHLLEYLSPDLPCYHTVDDGMLPGRITVENLIASGTGNFTKPREHGRLIVLTSGTSGRAKGAVRPHPKGFGTVAAVLSRIPLRMNETMLIPAPVFHTWGLAALQISTPLRATVILPEHFDAQECLRMIAEFRVSTLIVVPVMVHRILDLPASILARYDTSSLRIVASCGAPLPGATVLRFMDVFGEVLYNFYGSTEVSWASIADPADLRSSPTTAGRAPLGTKIAVLDEDRRPVPIGATGRIFISNHMLFDGYTDADPPPEAEGMLDTGDLGYLDASGRLFVAGRDDEMIISGGENIFPRPVEEVLSHLPQIREVAVLGVADREFGQRLAAFIVTRDGHALDPDMLRTHIRRRLGRFSVPRDIVFVDALPRNATGKVLKRVLTQPAATDRVRHGAYEYQRNRRGGN